MTLLQALHYLKSTVFSTYVCIPIVLLTLLIEHTVYCYILQRSSAMTSENFLFKSMELAPLNEEPRFMQIFFLLLRPGWFKNPVSSQTEKLMAGTKFSDCLGLNHCKKAKKLKYFNHLDFAYILG